MAKILYLIREPRFVQRDEPLREIPKQRTLFYLFWQIFGIIATVGVSQTIAGIGASFSQISTGGCPSLTTMAGFPVLIIALIPLRWKILPMIFTAKELRIMDAPTADNEVVLASLGGKPQTPGDKYDPDEETRTARTYQSSDETVAAAEEDKWSAAERGVPTEGMRKRTGDWKEP